MDDPLTLADALAELTSAEDFLDYFEIPHDPDVVQVNRLHILQRFHDYLAKQAPGLASDKAGDDDSRRAIYRQWLARAYADFVRSDALTEKVFAVLQHAAKPGGGSTAFLPLDKLLRE